MTDQEIEKLREKLGDGFEVTAGYNCAVITVKDIWDGVEFIERPTCQGKYEKICKVEEILTDVIAYRCSRQGRVAGYKNELKPSTESAYVEQLKAKAHELYGEIKDGDLFDRSDMGFEDNHRIGEVRLSFNGWDYSKSDDKLYLGSICIYQQGRWAKKIQQAIVTPVEIQSEEPDIVGDQVISIRMKIIHGHISKKNRVCVAYHLAKCLEDYLNKSQ